MRLPNALMETPIVLLTGAGASIPLGLPATAGFLAKLQEKAPSWPGDVMRFASIVYDRLSGDRVDIEHVLGTLEQQSQWIESLLSDDMFRQSCLSKESIDRMRTFQNVTDQLCQIIYDDVIDTYGSVDTEKAADLYRGLLGNFMHFFRPYCGGRETLPFFTLNYDTAVEEATTLLGIRCVDGFVTNPNGSGRRWSASAFTNYEATGQELSVVLLKLHGSVRLVERTVGAQHEFYEVPAATARNPRPWRHVVLYPSLTPKPITAEPFRTGYRMLRACLANSMTYCLIVIGCSFRDKELNDAIRDALDDNPHLHVLVVDPSLDHETVAQRVQVLPDRVHVIQGPFGPESENDLRSGRGRIMSQLMLWVGSACGVSGHPAFSGTSTAPLVNL